MLADYDDIRSRIAETPKWFDQNGVPRYSEFSPEDSPNIYADEVVLLGITCQSCRERFQVGLSMDTCGRFAGDSLADLVTSRRIHYGDPPRHGTEDGCLSGDTMNSVPVRVLQFWRKERVDGWPEWKRVPELEIYVTPDWATEEPGI